VVTTTKINRPTMVISGKILTWQKDHFAFFMSASFGVYISLPLDKK
jgi:hypothetical protein